MIRVYADDQLIYAASAGLEHYALQELRVTLSATASGTATITMPPDHPAIDSFVSYKTIVTIYRYGVLLFRGRALYATDDFYNFRTITCEGERGFLQDSVVRPYLYQDSPAAIFTDLIAIHNSQVEASKAFVVGEVTATDPNDYIRLESLSAEKTAVVLDKLIERVGGYIVFTKNNAGQRVINWYEDPGYRSSQVIEFGENLLDFTKTGANTDLATVIIPYGAELERVDEATGETIEYRVDITSVNNGLDYVQDDEAVALRGSIVRAVYWDDVTEPANLLRKAQQYLNSSKNLVTSLKLSAVDLSALDRNIDSFRVLDRVRVRSKPHALDEDFLLTDRTYDLLQPDRDTVTMGKDEATLTGADAAGDRNNQNQLHKSEASIRADYEKDIARVMNSTTTTMTSLIAQSENSILHEVSETYYTGEEVDGRIKSQLEQTAQGWSFSFDDLQKKVDDTDQYARDQFELQKEYIDFVDGEIHMHAAGSPFEQRMRTDRNSFYDGGAEVAYFSNKKLHVTDGEFTQALQVGNFKWIPRENKNMSLVKVGE